MPASRFADWDSFRFPPREATAAGDAPVAFCADLSPASVLAAGRRGIVPMPAPDDFFRTLNEFKYEDEVTAGRIALVGAGDDPYQVAWWSPDPRPVIAVGGVHLGRNARRVLRRDGLRTTANEAFQQVAEECRIGREPRWLTDALLGTLTELHAGGWAHSIEVWRDDTLLGGVMGIGFGTIISADSLFSRHPGAAAIALADMSARLAAAGGTLIDAQWDTAFVRSLGAELVSRDRYLALLGDPVAPVSLPGESLPALRLLGE